MYKVIVLLAVTSVAFARRQSITVGAQPGRRVVDANGQRVVDEELPAPGSNQQQGNNNFGTGGAFEPNFNPLPNNFGSRSSEDFWKDKKKPGRNFPNQQASNPGDGSIHQVQTIHQVSSSETHSSGQVSSNSADTSYDDNANNGEQETQQDYVQQQQENPPQQQYQGNSGGGTYRKSACSVGFLALPAAFLVNHFHIL